MFNMSRSTICGYASDVVLASIQIDCSASYEFGWMAFIQRS